MALSPERDVEREQRLKEVQETGISLLTPPSSTEELLMLLDKSEKLMMKMEQSSSEQTKEALLPMMRALKSHELFRSSVIDVKMSVLSCISEMTRITAPDPPYNDDVLKEFFHMLVPAFASLSETPTSRSYVKGASILEIAADVRFCLLMLDLELDKLVTEMLQLFLKTIRFDHPYAIFKHMESVMTMMVDESEEISYELLTSLLASVKKDNQNLSPASWKLGEIVLKNCASKLKPYIKKAVHSSMISLDDYSQIVTSICESESISKEDHVNDSVEHVIQAEENNMEFRTNQDEQSLVPPAGENKVENRTDQDEQFLVTRADDNSSENRTNQDEQSLVTKITALNCGIDNEIEISQDVEGITKSRMRNDSSPNRNDNTILTEDIVKHLEPCHLSKISRSADANENAEADKLDSTMVVKQEIDPEAVPKKRKWKPNTKMLPDEGYSHHWGSTEKKTHLRKSREKGVGRSHSSRKVSSPSIQDQVAVPPGFSPKVSEIKGASSVGQNGSLPEGSGRKRGRPKKIQVTLNGNGDISTPVSKVDIRIDQVNEETLQSGDFHIKKEPEDSSYPEPKQDLSAKDEILVNDTLKRKRKRKRTAGKEKASMMSDFGEQLLGEKIKVWWPLDKKFYVGVVKSYDQTKKKHTVLYTDGEEETLNLEKERWKLIGDDVSLDWEPEADLPELDSSSQIKPKRKRNRKSESSEQPKATSSSKRGRPPKKPKIEVDSEPNNPVFDEQPNGQKSTGSGSGSKPTTPEPAIVSNVESPQKCADTGSKPTTPDAMIVSNKVDERPQDGGGSGCNGNAKISEHLVEHSKGG